MKNIKHLTEYLEKDNGLGKTLVTMYIGQVWSNILFLGIEKVKMNREEYKMFFDYFLNLGIDKDFNGTSFMGVGIIKVR